MKGVTVTLSRSGLPFSLGQKTCPIYTLKQSKSQWKIFRGGPNEVQDTPYMLHKDFLSYANNLSVERLKISDILLSFEQLVESPET